MIGAGVSVRQWDQLVVAFAGLCDGTPMSQSGVPRVLVTAADVTPDILKDAEEVLDGWYADAERIDWEEFIDRLAEHHGQHCDPTYDIESYDTPAVRKIQAHIRELRRS